MCLNIETPLRSDLKYVADRMICMYCRRLCAAIHEAQGIPNHMAKLEKLGQIGTFCKGDLIIRKHYVSKHRDTSEI